MAMAPHASEFTEARKVAISCPFCCISLAIGTDNYHMTISWKDCRYADVLEEHGLFPYVKFYQTRGHDPRNSLIDHMTSKRGKL